MDSVRQRNDDRKLTEPSQNSYAVFILLKEICFYAHFLIKEIELFMSEGTNTCTAAKLKVKI